MFMIGPCPFLNQMERPAVHDEIHLFIVEPHLVQDCGLQVADVMRIFDGLIADLVG